MKPVSHYLIQLSQPLIDKITTESGIEFYIAPEFNFEWQVSVTGKIVGIPENPGMRHEHLKVNDMVAISYMVVNARKFTSDAHIFRKYVDEPYKKQYYDGNGHWIRITMLQLPDGKMKWVGTLTDKHNKLVDGFEGVEGDMQKWLAEFPMSVGTDFVYSNLVVINGKDYWKAEKGMILAKRLKDRLFATGEYAICEPIVVDKTQQVSIMRGIHIAPGSIMTRYVDRAKLISGGAKYGLKPKDTVSFQPQYVNKYRLFDENYFLVKESRILGTWN